MLDQDATHGAGSEPEEMAAPPRAGPARVDQSQPGFVDERRRLQRVARSLVPEQSTGHSLELVIEGLEKLLLGSRFAVLRGGEQAGRPLPDLVHGEASIGRLSGVSSPPY